MRRGLGNLPSPLFYQMKLPDKKVNFKGEAKGNSGEAVGGIDKTRQMKREAIGGIDEIRQMKKEAIPGEELEPKETKL